MSFSLKEVLTQDKVANVFFNLYERWLDERKYEKPELYGDVLAKALTEAGMEVKSYKVSQKPFGLKAQTDNGNYHVFVKNTGRYLQLCCKSTLPAPEIAKEGDANFKSPGFVYAHGKLEDDLKTDLFVIDLKGHSLKDGLRARYNGKNVVLHLYTNDIGQLTGVATYVDDEDAFNYGRNLVVTKPRLF